MRRRRRLPEPLDDGLVRLGGQLVDAAQVEWNASYHMDGFDELPKRLRDKINYAGTPEDGALPTRDLIAKLKDEARAKLRR